MAPPSHMAMQEVLTALSSPASKQAKAAGSLAMQWGVLHEPNARELLRDMAATGMIPGFPGASAQLMEHGLCVVRLDLLAKEGFKYLPVLGASPDDLLK